MHRSRPDLTPMTCARSAGALYLVIIVLGIFTEVGIRSSLIVAGAAIWATT